MATSQLINLINKTMDIINHLQALRQELEDETSEKLEDNKQDLARDRAITAIDNCIEALEELNNLE